MVSFIENKNAKRSRDTATLNSYLLLIQTVSKDWKEFYLNKKKNNISIDRYKCDDIITLSIWISFFLYIKNETDAPLQQPKVPDLSLELWEKLD